jgi:hypothetical protein
LSDGLQLRPDNQRSKQDKNKSDDPMLHEVKDTGYGIF